MGPATANEEKNTIKTHVLLASAGGLVWIPLEPTLRWLPPWSFWARRLRVDEAWKQEDTAWAQMTVYPLPLP